MKGESSTDEHEAFTSTWQYIRDGSILFMGVLSIIMQAVLMGMLDIDYKGAGIWFGVVAIFGGSFGIIANMKRNRILAWLWFFFATCTLFIAIGPMYFSALGWLVASSFDTGRYRLMAALSGVMFFCGMLSAIFSLFAACSATLLLTENYFERRRKRSPGTINVIGYD